MFNVLSEAQLEKKNQKFLSPLRFFIAPFLMMSTCYLSLPVTGACQKLHVFPFLVSHNDSMFLEVEHLFLFKIGEFSGEKYDLQIASSSFFFK